MKCNELMVGDWCCNEHGTPMQIINTGRETPYANCIVYERYWAFSDVEGFEPRPIPLTPEIMEKNGFWVMENIDNGAEEYIAYATAGLIFHYSRDNDYYFPNTPISWKYVHQLQQVLRLAGMTDMANNFKV